jgi:2,4-dienoyl-CoA reductase-like NADH-dependent reductase (Old Yellow Enzyme family)
MVQYKAKHGKPGNFHLVHLGQFALGRFGVVMTEATAVEANGRITHQCTGIWDDAHISSWKRITSFIKEQQSIPGIQLAHSGRKGALRTAFEGGLPYDSHETWPLVGPSAVAYANNYQTPHALSIREIENLVESFARATKRAEASGFDIIEIHGAHGYLIASFLSPCSNKRTDDYGGDLAGRMRFPLEVCRAVRAVWPAHKPLFFRVSAIDGSGGWGLEDTVELARELKICGIDVVDCSSGGLTDSITSGPIKRYPGFQVPYASAVRREAEMATIAVGLIMDAHQAESILQEGNADLIAIGRQALDDPHWPLHAASCLNKDQAYANWPEEYGWWLKKRAQSLAQYTQQRPATKQSMPAKDILD